MPPDSPRIAELRRRVHADPASIAFAQLAEEYRRTGHFQEAIGYCRTGLARHPGYLSARVTLGRSLMELGELDEAAREFDLVLRSAPDNLAAIRSMAEIHQRRGALTAALDFYTRALALARFDPELEESVNRIARELGNANSQAPGEGLSFEEATSQFLSAAARMPAAEPSPPRAPATEPLIDFDALLASIGVPDAAPPPVMETLVSDPAAVPVMAEPVMPELPAETQSGDPFGALERELRAVDEGQVSPHAGLGLPHEMRETAADYSESRVVQELEAWLRVLDAEPRPSPSA
ncbi:MAG TPA: tetratricopeptide repeat protein [Vicinamibacterales bacterium]|nr:tetratricopeptide repeat protein [Vicinamibacterales bacterium]